ncbi:MAG: RsbRD N-terminal domain-containing protein [Planctomycetota bacterium]|jgi:hypothetical protein
MDLNSLLAKKKPAILKRWYDLILGTYPADSSNFLKKELDRFRNPVGYTITHDLGELFEELLEGFDEAKILPRLEFFVKIRSVQDFTASQAVSFILQLKTALAECLAEELKDGNVARELLDFTIRLDRVALLAFDLYMQNREKLYELRTKQIKSGPFKRFERSPISLDEEKNGEDRKDGEV